jgi:hypothetical protein
VGGSAYRFFALLYEGGGIAAGNFEGLTAKHSFAANRAAEPQRIVEKVTPRVDVLLSW